MPTIEMTCPEQREHGTHIWRPEARPAGECFLPRYMCNGWWPRPRDNEDWPLTRRPRWVRKDQYWKVYEDGCRYCGFPSGHNQRDHQPALCALCGTVQCHRGQTCPVCYHGFMPAYRPGSLGICGYKGCGRVAVARVDRVARCCKNCASRAPVKVKGRKITLAELVTERLEVRDSGRQPNRWRLVA
jgi:hypothetical protein